MQCNFLRYFYKFINPTILKLKNYFLLYEKIMETENLLPYIVLGIFVWSILLSFIISSASRSKKIELQLKKQTDLLTKMAQKAGVPDNEIIIILNQVL